MQLILYLCKITHEIRYSLCINTVNEFKIYVSNKISPHK